jgi:DNA mismatch endonuclease, patch repair protein
MTDIVDKATRSRMMAGIRGKDTKPEITLRRALHARGLRFRLHDKTIRGRPDLVFSRFKAVVFVHGCFWHRHIGCKYATNPTSRADFWKAKFASNVARDEVIQRVLIESGWRVATVWECALRSADEVQATAELLAMWLHTNKQRIEMGQLTT